MSKQLWNDKYPPVRNSDESFSRGGTVDDQKPIGRRWFERVNGMVMAGSAMLLTIWGASTRVCPTSGNCLHCGACKAPLLLIAICGLVVYFGKKR
ncbi:MAG: hypothetical protein GY847_02360 [Proteobacteria bacterium]|nr:hypothetical protein [Pseudomonadota bacterium]